MVLGAPGDPMSLFEGLWKEEEEEEEEEEGEKYINGKKICFLLCGNSFYRLISLF